MSVTVNLQCVSINIFHVQKVKQLAKTRKGCGRIYWWDWLLVMECTILISLVPNIFRKNHQNIIIIILRINIMRGLEPLTLISILSKYLDKWNKKMNIESGGHSQIREKAIINYVIVQCQDIVRYNWSSSQNYSIHFLNGIKNTKYYTQCFTFFYYDDNTPYTYLNEWETDLFIVINWKCFNNK